MAARATGGLTTAASRFVVGHSRDRSYLTALDPGCLALGICGGPYEGWGDVLNGWGFESGLKGFQGVVEGGSKGRRKQAPLRMPWLLLLWTRRGSLCEDETRIMSVLLLSQPC